MAGKVKNEVEGQVKVSGEESLESFYSSIVGILSAMQVADPYARLFATALTTASDSADAGAIEKYTAALKKFNDTLARTASLVKSGQLSKRDAGLTDKSITDFLEGLVPSKGMTSAAYKKFKNSSGKEKKAAAEELIRPTYSQKRYIRGTTESTTERLGWLTNAFAPSESSIKAAGGAGEKAAKAAEKAAKAAEEAAKKTEGAAKAAESTAKRIEAAARKAEDISKKAGQAEKNTAARKTPANAKAAEDEAPSAQPRPRKRIVVDTRKKGGEGLLKKAEQARSGTIRQLSDIESDLYKELSDPKDVNISSDFKALLDKKMGGAGVGDIALYASMLSKSVNQGVSVAPKKVDRIHSLVNEWNVASRYNELRKEAHMPSMAVSGINSVMPELKFLASPFGTDRMAVSDSKIPGLEKQIKKINYDNRMKPETRLKKIREAIDSAYTMQTKGTADLIEIAEEAQRQADEARKQAEKNSQEIEKAKAQKPSEKTDGKALGNASPADSEETAKAVDTSREQDEFRSRWGKIVQENAPVPPQQAEGGAGQSLDSANISVTNGYFDIDKLADAVSGKDKGGKTGKLTGKELFNSLFEQPKRTNVNNATFGSQALTLTDQGELILGRKDDILAWINDPTNVVQFIQAALGKKITAGSRSGETLSSGDIYRGLSEAAKKAFGEGGHLGFIDREQISESRRKTNQKFDSETVNKIWSDRAYASGTVADILTSRNLLSDAQKKSILSGLLDDKGEIDYGRVGVVKSLTYSGRKEGWDKKHRKQDEYRSMSEDMAFESLNRKMAANGFSQSQTDYVNSFRGGEHGKQLAEQVYSLILEGIKENLSKRNSGWALDDTKRKAMRNGVTSYTDALGNSIGIDRAKEGDIDYIKRAIKLKPEQDIQSVASSMDGDYIEKLLAAHIEKYIGNLSKYDTRYIGRADRVKELKDRTASTQRLAALDAEPQLSSMLSDKISRLLTSGLSDKKVLSELDSLKNGGIEKAFKDFFDSIDKYIHTALDNVDDFLERQKKAEDGEKKAEAPEKKPAIDRNAPYASVYNSEQYKANSAMIQAELAKAKQLEANKNGASEEDTKRLASEIKKSYDAMGELRKQNKALETQAKNLADEQKRQRVTFGRSIGQSLKAGLYRWNQNSQSRGGIAGAFAKFGAQRMEGGSLQKLLGVNVGGIIGLGVAEAGKKIGELVSRGFKESMADFGNVQAIQTNLGTVYGSQSAADMRFADIAKYATKSPFGVQQTSDFAVLLKQSGVYENDLMKTLSMIGDVAGGNQEKYSRIANNYAQIVAADKATSMDLRQFANAGIPIYKAIKDYLGSLDKEKYGSLDTSAVRKMTQNGEITSDVIEGVFRMLTGSGGAFYNSVQRGAKTYKAQMQNMQDTRQLAGAAVGEWIFGIGRNDGALRLDKESKSIFQSILGVTENIYGAVNKTATTQNLKDKDKTAQNDIQRKKDIEAAIDFYKNHPDMDPEGDGLKYFEELLKNFIATYDYAAIRSNSALLYDDYNNKAEKLENRRQDLLKTNAGYFVSLNRKDKAEADVENFKGDRKSEEYKRLEKEKSDAIDEYNSIRGHLDSLTGHYSNAEKTLEKLPERIEKNIKKSLPYLYFKNQTLAESAMLSAYGMAAKYESQNKNSASIIGSWVSEQYKSTDAYKKEQEEQRKKNIEQGEKIARWQKENNVTSSNMFGFIANEKSITDLAQHLAESFVSEEGVITREKIADDDGSLTDSGKDTLKNISELTKEIFSNPELSKAFNGITVTRREADGSEGVDSLRSVLWDISSFAANPEFGTKDNKTAVEDKFYADTGSLNAVLKELNEKVNPTEQDNWLKVILPKILNPQTLSTVDVSQLKAIEESQPKEYIPLWKRIANQSLGVPIQMLANDRNNAGDLYDRIRTRNTAGQVATAMLQSGSSFSRVADLTAYTGATNSRINGGASATAQIDWKRTAVNIRDFALSLSSATEVTSAYVSSLSEQQSQVYSILTGWKSMEDFDKMTDEKLKDNLGQIRQWSKNAVTAYQSTFGYSGSAEDMDRNVLDTLYKIENSGGKERRVYVDKLTQQMSVLSEMLKTQRKTAETVLAIKSSIKDLAQQAETNEDEIFLNTVSTVGSGIPEFSGMRPEAEALLWKALSSSANSQQSLVQAYDTDKSGRLSYSELREHLPEILDELRGIGKSASKTEENTGKIQLNPVSKTPLASINDMAGSGSLRSLSDDEQARSLVKAVKGGTGRGDLNSMYRQTSFNAVKWGKYAKDNGLSLEQAMSVAKDNSSDLPYIKKGFGEADGSLRISSESVTVQAKEAAVQGVETGGDYIGAAEGSANRAADSADNLAYSNMYNEAYRKLAGDNVETDMSLRKSQIAMHAFDIPFVMPAMNALFGGPDGTRFQPYTNSAGDIMTQVGSNTRNQQRALNYLETQGFQGAGSKSMRSFVDGSINMWGSGAEFKSQQFKKDSDTLRAAAANAGMNSDEVADYGERLDKIAGNLAKGDESSIAQAKKDYEALVEEMSQGDLQSALDGQLKSLSQTMKETFSSNLLGGVSDSFAQIGKNLKDGESASKGMYSIWKNVGREITGTIGATMTSTGLQIAGSAAADKKWGMVAAGLAMAASGGICSIASGLLSDSEDSDSSSSDDGREQRIQNLKDALSDLIDQAKTDAEYYEKNLLHKNALSANEAVSTRSVNDAIITPGGDIVTTHPDDYLIATKTPGSLVGAGQASVTVQVNPVVINQSSANITAKTEAKENSDGSVDIVTTIVDVMNMALATGKADEGMAAYEANRNGRSVVS